MGNQHRQVKGPFCKWAPLNQNTEGQLLEHGVLSSSSMEKKNLEGEKERDKRREKRGRVSRRREG